MNNKLILFIIIFILVLNISCKLIKWIEQHLNTHKYFSVMVIQFQNDGNKSEKENKIGRKLKKFIDRKISLAVSSNDKYFGKVRVLKFDTLSLKKDNRIDVMKGKIDNEYWHIFNNDSMLNTIDLSILIEKSKVEIGELLIIFLKYIEKDAINNDDVPDYLISGYYLYNNDTLDIVFQAYGKEEKSFIVGKETEVEWKNNNGFTYLEKYAEEILNDIANKRKPRKLINE